MDGGERRAISFCVFSGRFQTWFFQKKIFSARCYIRSSCFNLLWEFGVRLHFSAAALRKIGKAGKESGKEKKRKSAQYSTHSHNTRNTFLGSLWAAKTLPKDIVYSDIPGVSSATTLWEKKIGGRTQRFREPEKKIRLSWH